MSKKKKNIYIAALELGEKHQDTGITYNQVKKHLSDTGYFEKRNEWPFKEWFYLNFTNNDWDKTAAMVRHGQVKSDFGLANIMHDNSNGVISSEAFFNLIDYKELREARETAKKAHKIAVIAICFSGIFALFSIVLQLLSL